MRTVLPRSARRMKNSRPWKVGTRRSDSPWRMSSGVVTRFAYMTAEKDEELTPLEGRYAQVGFPVEDEQRGGDAVRVHDRGEAQERRGVVLLEPGIVIDLGDIAGRNEAQP